MESRLPVMLVGFAIAALVAMLLVACSSSGSGDGSDDTELPRSAYAQCMRDNGAALPADAEGFGTDDLAAARAACADLLPEGAPEDGFGGGVGPSGPGAGAPSEAQINEVVECLREQGLDVPDDPLELRGSLDPSDPDSQEALSACLGGGFFGP